MADEKEKPNVPANAPTNVLLAQILDTDKQILDATIQGNADILKATQVGNALLKQIANAISGGEDSHVFTVLVKQIASEVAKRLSK